MFGKYFQSIKKASRARLPSERWPIVRGLYLGNSAKI